MIRRVILFGLLAANLILAAGWILAERRQAQLYHRNLSLTPATTQTKTNVLIRRQFFTWQQVESDDYPTFIANLRGIGCPEQTVRDIIIADVNAVYARKRATEIITPEQQWWRTDADTNVTALALARGAELDEERRALLASLLGTNWETGDQINLPRPSRPGLNLDGPVLGVLPNELKQTVQEINARANERTEAYIAAQKLAGKPVDETELAKLRQQTRTELAAVLSPFQLEEFLLRYSQSADVLRTDLSQLKFFKTTPEEFRAIFRATDPINQQLDLLGDSTDVQSAAQRNALLAQGEAALKLALGADRYEQYIRLHDAGYRDAFAAAQKAGDPAAAPVIYEINQATAQELARLRANTNFSPTQLAIELKKAELEQLKANAAALGQEIAPDPAPAQKPPPPKVHQLIAGENLTRLSQLYGVDPNALRAANPNLNLDNLKPGDAVNVPINYFQPVGPVPVAR